jgi:hypothetical protein
VTITIANNNHLTAAVVKRDDDHIVLHNSLVIMAPWPFVTRPSLWLLIDDCDDVMCLLMDRMRRQRFIRDTVTC